MSGFVRSGGYFGRVWGKSSPGVAAPSLPKYGDRLESYDFRNRPWLQRDRSGLFPLMAEEKTEEGYLRISPLQLKALKNPGSNRVSVTAASAPFCEVRTLYELAEVAVEEEKPTNAMERGAQVHNMAEYSLYEATEVSLPVPPATTPTEEWYQKLMNMYLKLSMLRTDSAPAVNELEMSPTFMAREIPVFGNYKNTRLFGIMDLIYWRNKKLNICDMKTTYRRSVPEEPQMTSHIHQTMLYHYLFSDMCRDIDATMGEYLRDDICIDTDVRSEFSAAYEGQSGPADTIPTSISGLIKLIGDELPKPRSLAKTVSVEYVKRSEDRVPEEYQDLYPLSDYTQRQSFAVVQAPVDYKELKRVMSETLPFWHGQRAAIGVDADSMNKCRYCQFRPVCGWYN
ncbi:exonuclease V [Yarrowia lipolytica]|uniref:Exonuclease V, mitochondrial n=1 Tax=Yarrowia lipolytica TaxID=4952 RepID=A0A371C1K7_YARLL|nr:exonuclease V [Yarrowia lipolytica]